MSASNSKKKILLSIIIVSSVSLCVCLFYLLNFMNKTTLDFDKVCSENSHKNATEFYMISCGFDGYFFFVSENGDKNAGQELFVFREESFGLIKKTGRYILDYHSGQNDEKIVGSYLFKPIIDEKKADKSYMIFYSSNSQKINKCILKTEYLESMKRIKKEVVFETSELQSFIFTSSPLSADEKITEAKFYDSDSNLIFEY